MPTRPLTLLLALFATSAANNMYPKHWGAPPEIQTMDIRPLAGGYGQGSSTMNSWIKTHIKQDIESQVALEERFPPAFGSPPRRQTRDLRQLPFGYGQGSSTLAQWITEKAKEVYQATAEEYEE